MSDTQSPVKTTKDPIMWVSSLIVVLLLFIVWVRWDPTHMWRPANENPPTDTVWVCTNAQIPLTANDWVAAGPGYPPPLGEYRVTYMKSDPSMVDTIEMISTSTAGCQ